ncbi:MAG: DUF2975 domain-containing protein [Clostridiales Family XIII bacterium]|jgi:hypothetical protein|nr:DUF2975 domain-containing protein [Clostridiales Family XIII bacterium]
MKTMWNSMRSVKLSIFCTRLVVLTVALSAAGVVTPAGRDALRYTFAGAIAQSGGDENLIAILILYYVCCVPALAALFLLDRLLANIKKGLVFTEENVRALRAISWCCFAEAFILAVAALRLAPTLFAVAVVMAFFGLILRVVKNVIDAAVALKFENDFTI